MFASAPLVAVLDDSDLLLRAVERALRVAGLRCASGETADAMLAQIPDGERANVLLVDGQLLLRRATAEALRDPRVRGARRIVITGFPQGVPPTERVLLKPFTPGELLDAIGVSGSISQVVPSIR